MLPHGDIVAVPLALADLIARCDAPAGVGVEAELERELVLQGARDGRGGVLLEAQAPLQQAEEVLEDHGLRLVEQGDVKAALDAGFHLGAVAAVRVFDAVLAEAVVPDQGRWAARARVEERVPVRGVLGVEALAVGFEGLDTVAQAHGGEEVREARGGGAGVDDGLDEVEGSAAVLPVAIGVAGLAGAGAVADRRLGSAA